MKTKHLMVLFVLLGVSVWAQRTLPTSETDARLRALLKIRPEADLDQDGVLTLEEVRQAREAMKPRTTKPPQKNQPTHSNVSYGPHGSMTLDFWKAEADAPTPLFVFIHGGGFRGGDKSLVNAALLNGFLEAGVSVASINYRLSGIAPYPAQMHDSARAVQFLRSKADEWNLDPERVAAGGGSAGSGISQWLAFHDDLKNPASTDPVERRSTRLRCALALNMQSTYDPRVIQKIIPGNAFDDAALKPFYNLPGNWNWETNEIDDALDALIKDASPINHLSKDDPPVFVFHSERTRTPGNIHHPNFGNHLADAMHELGIECVRKTDADYDSRNAPYEDMVKFVLRHMGP
ncbi:alpha/beta hydrolase fold domain-containing protein [Pontiella sp.]|uniref:alpha/beta hydrolase fold domain-containing protein n=1 Tax=Pontiella sp. TaxID=2837462 RepID=UPI003561FFA2